MEYSKSPPTAFLPSWDDGPTRRGGDTLDVRPFRSRLRAVTRLDAGQSLVELALVLPILCYSLIGILDVARGYAALLAVQNGARAGAEATAIEWTPGVSTAQTVAQDEMSRTPGVDPSTAIVTMTMTDPNGVTCTTSTIASPCFVTVRVQYTFATTIPWPWLPSQFHMDRSTTIRRFV